MSDVMAQIFQKILTQRFECISNLLYQFWNNFIVISMYDVFVLLFYIYINKKVYQQSYILFPFCPTDSAIVVSVHNQDDCVSLIKHKCQNQTLNKMKSCLSNSNFFVWVQLRWEVIIHFVDNGGIDDHHCLNFLFIIPI